MGCTASTCTSPGIDRFPRKTKDDKLQHKKKKHDSSQQKSRQLDDLESPRSISVFNGDLDLEIGSNNSNDHADWEARDLENRKSDDEESDVTVEDQSDTESETTVEGEYGQDDDHLIGAGKSSSKWTVTVQLHSQNHRINSSHAVPSVEVINKQAREGGAQTGKRRNSVKRKVSGILNPVYSWGGDSAASYKEGQGQTVQDQGQSHRQTKDHKLPPKPDPKSAIQNQDHKPPKTNKKKKKRHKDLRNLNSEEVRRLRANYVPVRSCGEEEEDTWQSLCDSTAALDAESRCDSRADDFDDNFSMATSLDTDSIITDYLDSDIVEDFSGSTHSLNTLSSAKALNDTTNNTATMTTTATTGTTAVTTATGSRTSTESGFVNGKSEYSSSSILLGRFVRDLHVPPESLADSDIYAPTVMTTATTNTTNPRHRPKAARRQRSVTQECGTQ